MKIGVVIVTYNRLNKLKITLEKYENQTVKPAYVMVVDNHSTDDTSVFLGKWQSESSYYSRIVLSLSENTGGSGGFYAGLKESLTLDVDWVWVADDDAYPDADAFQQAEEYVNNHDCKNISAICGTVYKSDGKTIDVSHRRNIYSGVFNLVFQPYSKVSDYDKEFKINCFSYVGTMINKQKLCSIPLTKKDYFIYYDDTDHSYRLSKIGDIVVVPTIKIIHDAPHEDKREIVKWKLYYLIRNALDFIYNNFDEKVFKMACSQLPIMFKMAVLLYGKDKKSGFSMINEAKKDARKHKTGLHSLYRPGWKPNKNY